MKQRPDAALEVALEQRQRVLDQERKVLAERDLAVQDQAAQLSAAESRVRMVLMQIDAAQRPVPGVSLAVTVLGDLERLLDWCEVQAAIQKERLDIARGEAATAHGATVITYQRLCSFKL